LHSFLEIKIVIIVIKRKERTLRRPYRTRARARVMSEIEDVQEHMKVDMEAMKGQMATMMEGMMSMKTNDGGQRDYSCCCKYRHRSGPNSLIEPQSSKSSSLGYGRSGRRSIGKYR